MTLNENFKRLKQLHEDNRNHIWSYYVRNVSRPAWLSHEENRVDVLVGNPPWLSYRHMTPEMQSEFKTLARDRGFWHRENTATHQDLAGVFVARAVERYLKTGGKLAFVVPNSVIDRDYWGGFRVGRFDGAGVRFTIPWDLRRVRPHMFPRGSAVIFGERSDKNREMPPTAVVWMGRVPRRQAALDYAAGLTQSLEPLSIGSDEDELSPYHPRFAQGATLVPRFLCRVKEVQAGALGAPAGRVSIRSDRSVSEKKPWKPLADLTGTVERQFLFPTLLGEHVLPFRTLSPDAFVLPLTRDGVILEGSNPKIDAYPGLATWVRSAEERWNQYGAGNMTFAEQLDYRGKLSQQVPATSLRIVYATSGMHIAAALVHDPRAIIDTSLYWASVSSETEGYYLTALLNAPITTVLLRPLMPYSKDERHIHKHVWRLPIPMFDRDDALHLEISRIGRELTETLAGRELVSEYFVTARQDFRRVISTKHELNRLVTELLGEPPLDETVAAPTPAGLIKIASGSLGLDPVAVEIDLDIEFDEEHRVYLWGFLVSRQDNGESTYVDVGSSDPHADHYELAKSLFQKLGDVIKTAQDSGQTVRIYHYGSVEPLYLERLLGPDADALLALSTDLLATVREHFFSGVGYGLKRLAPLAGFTWSDDGMTGARTYELIAKARNGDVEGWSALLRYNEDDTRATKALREYLREQ